MQYFRSLSAGCALALSMVAAVTAEPIVIASEVPYAETADIQKKVREECTQLNAQLAQFIQQYAGEKGQEVVFGDPMAVTGRTLRVEITNAMSQGNAFLGHSKSSSSRGALYENGQKVASFRATRNSMGGAFAGFKGSCSVLGRTMEAMGMDIGAWLADPVDEAELGDR